MAINALAEKSVEKRRGRKRLNHAWCKYAPNNYCLCKNRPFTIDDLIFIQKCLDDRMTPLQIAKLTRRSLKPVQDFVAELQEKQAVGDSFYELVKFHRDSPCGSPVPPRKLRQAYN